jgi:hypothetical protein
MSCRPSTRSTISKRLLPVVAGTHDPHVVGPLDVTGTAEAGEGVEVRRRLDLPYILVDRAADELSAIIEWFDAPFLDDHRLKALGTHDRTEAGAAGRMIFPGNDAGKTGPGLTGCADGKNLEDCRGQVGGDAILGVEGIQPPIRAASLISTVIRRYTDNTGVDARPRTTRLKIPVERSQAPA